MPEHMLYPQGPVFAEVGKSLKGARIALLSRTFINDFNDTQNTLAGR